MNFVLRASSLRQAQLCPGSAVAQLGLPEQKSDMAEIGTRLHAAFAGDVEVAASLDMEEMETLQILISRRDALSQEFGSGAVVSAVIKEAFYQSFRNNEPFVEGHPDEVVLLAMEEKHRGLVWDAKTGWKEQEEPAINLQLRAYAYLVFDRHPEIDEIVAGLIPGKFSVPRPVLYERADIPAIEAEIRGIRDEASKFDAPRNPSMAACRFCKALGTARCPETQMAIDHSARPVIMATLSPEQKSNRLQMFALALKIIERETELYRSELEADPNAIPGWTLTEGTSKRVIVDAQRAFEALGDGFDSAAFVKICKLGIGDYEKIFARATGIKGPALKSEMKLRLGPAIEIHTSRPSLKQTGPQLEEAA